MKEYLSFREYDVFLIPSQREGVLLYAPLLQRLFRVEPSLAECLSEGGFFPETKHKGIKQIISSLEEALSNAVEPSTPASANFFHLSLELTRNCTLNCSYCHADAGKNEFMSEKILDDAIKYTFCEIKDRDIKKINVSYVAGGEPTLAWDLLVKSVNKLRAAEEKYKIPTSLAITTNGYYGREKRVFLTENFNNIALSFDGPQKIQDAHRPTRAGQGSYTKVLDSARYFKNHSPSFIIRSTITEDSVELMLEIVKFFYNELGPCLDLIFEPSFPAGRARPTGAAFPEKYVKNYIQAKELSKSFGIKLTTSAEAAINNLVATYCGGLSLPSFVVTTRGIVTACEGDAEGKLFKYGTLFDGAGFIQNTSSVSDFNKFTTLPQKCSSCFAKFHCAGGCSITRDRDEDICNINKGLVQYGLEQLVT